MAITVIRAMDMPLTPMDGMVEATIQISDTTMIGRIITMAGITIPFIMVRQAVLTSVVGMKEASVVGMEEASAAAMAVAGIARCRVQMIDTYV
jgi:hypothetical protein